MFVTSLKLQDKKLIAVPLDKEVSCIEYTDGTCDVHVDLPNDVLAFIYQKAAEENITAEQAATNLITKVVENFLQENKEEIDEDSSESPDPNSF